MAAHDRPPPFTTGGEDGPYRSVGIITSAVFSGYAVLVVMQERLGEEMGLVSSTEYHHACTMIYVGNLIFRLAHNFVFACVRPRHRVYIALASMALSSGLLAFVVVAGQSYWIGWVYICYFAGGLAVGSFESNLLSSITPLGSKTKVWAIVGMPLGFNVISIGGFALLAPPLDVPLMALYVFVFVACCSAMVVFYFMIPDVQLAGNALSFSSFTSSLSDWRQWLPSIRSNAVALALDMFFVSFFCGIMLYILDDKQWVPLFGRLDGEKSIVNHDMFFAVYGVFMFLGDSLSRMFAYWIKPQSATQFLPLAVLGAGLCLCEVPLLALLGIFLVFFANGAIYGCSTRFIDMRVPRKYNLVALSFWLFVGDVGAVAGANTWSLVQQPYCDLVRAGGAPRYFCLQASVAAPSKYWVPPAA